MARGGGGGGQERVEQSLYDSFFQTICKLEFSNMVYICRMSDCFVGLRVRRIVRFNLFYPFSFLSLFYMFRL